MENSGSNAQDLKMKNRLLILKMIATHKCLSRTQLAEITGLTKMTIGNIVSEMLTSQYITEFENENSPGAYGRKPISLKISDKSPCICGMVIKRDSLQVILGDLSGSPILSPINIALTQQHYDKEFFIDTLYKAFLTLKERTPRPVIAIGVSSIGPLNSVRGILLRPPFFHNIQSLPIVEPLEKLSKTPVFLMNDANAGALAEQLYGTLSNLTDFIYIPITDEVRIGAGVVLGGKLYDGNFGQNGGLGHTSINFAGPKCDCGNYGCLELYANTAQMQQKINSLQFIYPRSIIPSCTVPNFSAILDAANTNDELCILALDEFCSYLAKALTNILNILDVSLVVLDYSRSAPGNAFEYLLSKNLAALRPNPYYHEVAIKSSSFNGNAALIGSISIVANKIFNCELPFLKL